MRYMLLTYGCQMNTADSEEMAQPLKERGFVQTIEPAQADIIIMNTCTVREQAEHRAQSNLGRLRDWKASNPDRILIVAGCAASRWGDSIQKRYPYIDAVSPATRIEEFPELIAKVLKERWNWDRETRETFLGVSLRGGSAAEQATDAAIPVMSTSEIATLPTVARNDNMDLFGSESTAYVTIMRGCNYSCSYCIVPQVRGREVYRPMPEILEEIERKVTEGYRDVMLLGQTVNSYYYRPYSTPSLRGENAAKQVNDAATPALLTSEIATQSPAVTARNDNQVYDFADLLYAVDSIPGIERIRFMSPHPRHMREPVIQAMATCKKVARHIHLPLQSGSNRLLAEMKRLYTREAYGSIVQALRDTIPGILVTTDIIVGYPGETEADFQDTLNALKDIQFDGLFAFKFSPRPGTAAAEQPDDVPSAEKEKRLQQVLSLNQTIKAWAN